jgi:hypothetical protein
MCACSTTPTPLSQRSSVRSDRIANAALLSSSAERNCRVTITRDQGLVGAGVGLNVFLDGQQVAKLGTGESITIYTSSGRHFVGVKYAWGPPAAPAEKDISTTPREPISLRISIDQDGNLDVKPQSELL